MKKRMWSSCCLMGTFFSSSEKTLRVFVRWFVLCVVYVCFLLLFLRKGAGVFMIYQSVCVLVAVGLVAVGEATVKVFFFFFLRDFVCCWCKQRSEVVE